MKRDFLKNLGIEDKDLIDKILDENSADIGRAKGELQAYKDKVVELENTLKTKDDEITTLTQKVGDVDALNNQIKDLQTNNSRLNDELNSKVNKLQKDHAIESRIRDRKGKNVKAIKALLDEEKITYENNELGGIDDQLDALEQAEDSSMLFGDGKPTAPSGTEPKAPPTSGGTPTTGVSFKDAIANALANQKN